jgi:hypothetical protein
MKPQRTLSSTARFLTLAFLTLPIFPLSLLSKEEVGVTEITPTVVVFATSSGNVVASIGPDGALLIGTPSAASTGFISDFITTRTKSPRLYVVVYPESLAKSEGDAGWGRLGAFVAMHEKALQRLGGAAMGSSKSLPSQFATLGVGRPSVAFSEVLAFDLNGDAIHVVHLKPGYSDADALTHFHLANVFYLGEAFPGDGYPQIDLAQGGTIDGLLEQLVWTEEKQHIVPARGKVTSGTSLKAFRDMVVTVRDRIQRMIQDGRTEEQVLAAHPTSDFDAQWGHGRTSSDDFVRQLYAALRTKK